MKNNIQSADESMAVFLDHFVLSDFELAVGTFITYSGNIALDTDVRVGAVPIDSLTGTRWDFNIADPRGKLWVEFWMEGR